MYARAALWRGRKGHVGTDECGTAKHHRKTESAVEFCRIEAAAVVFDRQLEMPVLRTQRHRDPRCGRMLDRIGRSFLRDTIELNLVFAGECIVDCLERE